MLPDKWLNCSNDQSQYLCIIHHKYNYDFDSSMSAIQICALFWVLTAQTTVLALTAPKGQFLWPTLEASTKRFYISYSICALLLYP